MPPVYEVETPSGVFEVESDRDLTDEEVVGALAAQGVRLPAATDRPPPETASLLEQTGDFLRRHAATGVRAAGGAVAGAVGAVPGPGTAAAAVIGAAAEGAAQSVEIAQGTRAEFNLGSIATEAAISAVPLGRVAKGVSLGRAALKEAGKVAAVEAVGAQARSLAERGELATPAETAIAAAGGGVAGAVGGALARGAAREVAEEVVEAPLEKAARTIGETAGAREPREAIQYGLFDDAGRVRPNVAEFTQPTVEGITARASGEMTAAVKAEGRAAAELLASTEAAGEGRRLYLQVAESFERGDFDAPGLVRELAERGMSMPEFVRLHYAPGVKRAGRILQQLSALRQHLDELADPEAREAMAELSKVVPHNRFWAFLQKLDDTRRSLLVSQVKTGVRNAISQGAAYGTDLVEQAGKSLVGGDGDFFGHLSAFTRAMGRRESRQGVEQMLRYRRDLYRKLGVFEYAPGNTFIQDVPILDATVGRFTNATTWVNRFQEEFFRRAKFDAVVRQGLAKRGIDVTEALTDARLIPEDLLEDATEKALQLTFAGANPGGLHKVIAGAQLMRPISTLIAPFPRYLANAMTYVVKRSPLGLMRLATQHGRQDASTVLAEGAVGTMLFAGALATRINAGGEKWYELAYGNKRFDMRGFAGPFAPYLFAAEAFRQYMENETVNFTGQDILDGVLGVSRVAGTTSSILSFLTQRVDDPRAWNKYMAKIAGEWVAGFATPAKVIKDALTVAGVEEPVLREAKEEPFLGPLKAALPLAQRDLPARVSLTTGDPIPLEHPELSGTLGLNVRTTNPVEAELNRLGVSQLDVAPKTGIPRADRELYRRVGKVMSSLGPRAMETQAYQRATDAEKVLLMKGLFRRARDIARDHLESTEPRLAAAVKASDRLTADQRRVLRERGIDVEGAIARWAEGRDVVSDPDQPGAPEPEARAPSGSVPDQVRAAAAELGVDADFALRLANQESRFNPEAVSQKGARGVMQVMPGTSAEVRAKYGEMNPIRQGLLYLRERLADFAHLVDPRERQRFAAAAYNAGPARVRQAQDRARRAGKDPDVYASVRPYLPDETRDYVRIVAGG